MEMEGIYVNVRYDERVHKKPRTTQTGPESPPRRFDRPAAVFLGLLSVLLLAGIISLSIFYRDSTRQLHAMEASLTWMTEQRDRLNVSLTSTSKDLERLQSLSDQRKTCPAGWKMFECSCYFFSESKTSWDRSRQDCRHRDADLVVIQSSQEQEFLTNTLGGWAWIGLTDRDVEDTWRWTDGTSLTVKYWGSGQPDSNGPNPQHGEEDCVHIMNDHATEANWNDMGCDKSMLWICEK